MSQDTETQMNDGLRKISELLFARAKSDLVAGEEFEWYLALRNANDEVMFTILQAEVVEDPDSRTQFLMACHLWGVIEYHIVYFGKQVEDSEDESANAPAKEVILVFGRNSEDSVFGVAHLADEARPDSVGDLDWLGALEGDSLEQMDLHLIVPDDANMPDDDVKQAFYEDYPILDFDQYQKFSYHVLLEGGDVSNTMLN